MSDCWTGIAYLGRLRLEFDEICLDEVLVVASTVVSVEKVR